MEVKILIVYVYKHPLGDCTNGGVSSKFDTLKLINDEGITTEIDENYPPQNLVKLVTRTIAGREYKHIEPLVNPKEGYTSYMSGGNVAYTSDSRFPNDYPLAIHDRTETWNDYDMLST